MPVHNPPECPKHLESIESRLMERFVIVPVHIPPCVLST